MEMKTELFGTLQRCLWTKAAMNVEQIKHMNGRVAIVKLRNVYFNIYTFCHTLRPRLEVKMKLKQIQQTPEPTKQIPTTQNNTTAVLQFRKTIHLSASLSKRSAAEAAAFK